MSPTQQQKNGCTTCGKMAGVFSCRGCSGNFCLSHTKEHRDHLEKSMDDIVRHYQQLKQNLEGQTAEEYQKSLREQIDRWEEESVKKIHRLARDTREELETTVRSRTAHLKEKLEQLKQRLDKARNDGGFYENDLKDWENKLHDLKRTYVDQQTLQIDEDSHSGPFIGRISLNDTGRNARQPDPQVPNSYYDGGENDHHPAPSTSAYHKHNGNYSATPKQVTSSSKGRSEHPFSLEGYDDSCSLLFGIISESANDESNAYNNPTFFGWDNKSRVFQGGQMEKKNYDDYQSDFQADDVCVLIIDRQQQKIIMKNERTNSSYELNVDRERCPSPWLVHVRLYSEAE